MSLCFISSQTYCQRSKQKSDEFLSSLLAADQDGLQGKFISDEIGEIIYVHICHDAVMATKLYTESMQLTSSKVSAISFDDKLFILLACQLYKMCWKTCPSHMYEVTSGRSNALEFE